MDYFVIRNGDTTIRQYSKEELLEFLSEDEIDAGLCKSHLGGGMTCDTNDWEEGEILIIKGTIVVPEAIKVATEYNID